MLYDIDMLQSCIEFDGRFQGGLLEAPLYPLKLGVSRGPLGLSGGQAPSGSGPLVIRPLLINPLTDVTVPTCVGFTCVRFRIRDIAVGKNKIMTTKDKVIWRKSTSLMNKNPILVEREIAGVTDGVFERAMVL